VGIAVERESEGACSRTRTEGVTNVDEEEALTSAICVMVDEDGSDASRRCPCPRGQILS
jgi:hypothetical protein